MKRCYKCKELLSLDAFAPSVARRLKSGYGRACQRECGKQYYRANKALINQKRLLRQREYRLRNRKRIAAYLENHACVECGERDARVLEFDHVRGKKDRNISDLVTEGWAWQRILVEIAKCEVRCANCHRRRTVEQFGWLTAIGT